MLVKLASIVAGDKHAELFAHNCGLVPAVFLELVFKSWARFTNPELDITERFMGLAALLSMARICHRTRKFFMKTALAVMVLFPIVATILGVWMNDYESGRLTTVSIILFVLWAVMFYNFIN